MTLSLRLGVPGPSLVTRYISRLFLTRFLFVLAGITALAELLELFANADDIMKEEVHALAALARYGLLRLPEIITVMAAPSASLAALLALGALVRHRELVSLKAAGVSQVRLFLALLPAAFLVMAFEWTVQDRLVPPAIHSLREWGVGDYGKGKDADDSMQWVRDGRRVVNWETAQGQTLTQVKIFDRDQSGRLTGQTRAARAEYRDGRWTLHGVTQLDVGTNAVIDIPDRDWTIPYTPRRFEIVSAPPNVLSFRTLAHFATNPTFGNRPVYFYWTWLFEKIAAPLGTLILALLAVPLTQQFQRPGGIVLMLAAGVVTSFLYLILRGVMVSFGESGVLPPLLATAAPALVLLAVGGTLFVRHERY
jgi:lipopolysaccharide export system permease protein